MQRREEARERHEGIGHGAAEAPAMDRVIADAQLDRDEGIAA